MPLIPSIGVNPKPGAWVYAKMKDFNKAEVRRAKCRVVMLAIIFFSTAALHGCSQIRKVTYPPDYVYLEQKQVKTEMALLGFYVRQMNEILSQADEDVSQKQSQVLELLSLMDKTANSVSAGNKNTNHLFLDEHMDEFKSDLYAAIRAVRQNPPNYFFAGEISGSCIACHKFRRF